jgi:hypothetical protein
MAAVAANLHFFRSCFFAELTAVFLIGLASTGNVGTFLRVGHKASSKRGSFCATH